MSKRDFRTNYVLLLLVVVAVVATSCKSDVVDGRQAGQIPIYSSVSRGVADKTSALSGITFLRKDDANPSLTSMNFSNSEVFAGDRPAGDGAQLVRLNKQQYYLTAGGEKTVYLTAFHPSDGGAMSATSYTMIRLDGSVDFVTTGVWNGGRDSNPSTTSMEFKHQFARVEVILQAASPGTAAGAQARWGAITDIQLDGISTGFEYSFSNQTLAGVMPATVSLLKGNSYTPGGVNGTIGEPGNKTIQFASMLVPTTSNSIRVKVISANGGSVPLTVTMSEALVAGKIHTLTISFAAGTDNISIDQTGIAAWDTNGVGGSGSGSELPLPPPTIARPFPYQPCSWDKNSNLWWATGNLIADGAYWARVGAPTDGGLYFQFGSLIGWNGGANGNGTGVPANDAPTTPALGIAVNPVGYTGATTWGNAGYFNDASVVVGTIPTSDSPVTGIGDACRYYLGGTWRLPTIEEYVALWGTPPETNGPWQDTPPGRTINSLFFPASGTRDRSNGSFYLVGSLGCYWSGSVYDAWNGVHVRFSSKIVSPRDRFFTRPTGFPVRCVSGVDVIRMDSDKPGNRVSREASTFTITTNGAGSQNWTLTETADASAAFTPSTTSGKGDGTFTVSVLANPSNNTRRSATYKLNTASGLMTHITLTQEPFSMVLYKNLWWAEGNLIADGANGARVGAPTDGGLYFQFGGLIGWTGGANGNGTGAPANDAPTTPALGIAVKPSGYTGATTWGSTTGGAGYFKDQSVTSGVVTNLVTDNPATGIGDACRYYLGGTWRLPTIEEYEALWGTPPETNGPWQDTPPGRTINSLFFPASGYRYRSNGSFDEVGRTGCPWSGSVYPVGTYGFYLYFINTGVTRAGTNRSYGFPVRCVSEP